MSSWKDRARALRRDVHAIYLAARDPRTPWLAKALAVCVAAYALSPIDLIPDVIPVLGLLDDIILVPLGILLVVKLIPGDVMADARERATEAAEKPVSWMAAVVIVAMWIAAMGLVAWWVWRWWSG